MLLQKTFHLHMARDVAKTRLSDLREYRRDLVGIERAVVTADGMAHLEFLLPCGFRGKVDLAEVPGENPAQTLFRSRDGNIDIVGVIEYFAVRPDLTEVVLTIDYKLGSPLFRLVDYFWKSLDRFLNRQLDRVEEHFARPIAGVRADRNLPVPINGHRVSHGTS